MIRTFNGSSPKIDRTAFVHDAAEVIGKVVLKKHASVWPMCVLRGDLERISIGERSNIQDLTVIHTRAGFPTIVGKDVTVGHAAIVHGARIGDGALIGMGAIVMEAKIGKGAIVAAGALVPAGMTIPANTVAMGSPAKIIRKVRAGERAQIRFGIKSYKSNIEKHKKTSRVVFPK
jgi:carbonic anhydrase/acetyltransferase-like protein (isoleucine patch superfamily)